MADPKLTPWFVKGTPPVHTGVYLVCSSKNPMPKEDMFAHFGPKGWGCGAETPAEAYEERDDGGDKNFYHRIGSWRGLAEKPE